MKNYKTKSLDLAAYLFTKGYEPKVKYLSEILCEYTYPSEVEKLVKSFLLGNVQCNLQKFLYARYALKQLTKKLEGIEKGETVKERKARNAEYIGKKYYTIVDNYIVEFIYGKDEVHEQRRLAGNYYPTKELAQLGLNHKKTA